MDLQRLAIGTAQFGLNYGIANKVGRVSSGEARNLLLCARERGVRTLDTAASYGDSERCLGEIGVNEWEIISKIPPLPQITQNLDLHKWFEETLHRSLERLRVNTITGLLLHQPSDLIGAYGEVLYSLLADAKKAGITKKIGISVYTPAELDILVDRHPIDIVQLPFNILDQRFAELGWLTRLNKAGIEVHSRSVFLQGLLLMSADARPKKFLGWSKLWDRWDQWLKNSEMSPLVACLSVALMQKKIDRVVIGFDNLAQFEQLCDTNIGPGMEFPTFTDCAIEELINPSTWSKL